MNDLDERCRHAGLVARAVGQTLAAGVAPFVLPDSPANVNSVRDRHRSRVAIWAVGAVALMGVVIVAEREDRPTIRSVIVPSTDGSNRPPVNSATQTSPMAGSASTLEPPSTTVASAPVALPFVKASITVPNGRMAIAEAGGTIWVGSQLGAEAGSHIVGIDPATNAIVATIDRAGTHSMAAGFGSLWACSPDSLARIDPATATVIATFPFGCYAGLTIGFGSVWAESGPKELTRLDPTSGTVIARVTLPEAGWGLAAGPDSIWAANGGPGPGHISRIDPSTNSIVASIAVPVRTRNIVADETGVWLTAEPGFAAGPRTSTIRIDPATNTIAKQFDDGLDAVGIDRAGPYLWVVSYNGAVAVIDTRTDRTVLSTDDLVAAGAALGGDRVLWAAGSIWITEQTPGGVLRVNPGAFAPPSLAGAGV